MGLTTVLLNNGLSVAGPTSTSSYPPTPRFVNFHSSRFAVVAGRAGCNVSQGRIIQVTCLYVVYIARCFILALTVRRPAYTLPGGEPRMRETMASRATLMFWKEPMIWILLIRGYKLFLE